MGKTGSRLLSRSRLSRRTRSISITVPARDKDSVIYQVSAMLLGYPDEETLEGSA